MEQVRGGDHEAFATLFSRFRQRVGHQAHALLQSEADAEDIVQEVFATLYTKAIHFEASPPYRLGCIVSRSMQL